MKHRYKFITLFSFFMVITSCEKQYSNADLDEFCSVVPAGWDCQITFDGFNPQDIPASSGQPYAMIYFNNLNRSFLNSEEREEHPSLILNFYPIQQKSSLIALIKSQQIYSWCIPSYYGETQDYFILTSPCFINGGCYTEEANASIEDLQLALESIISKVDYNFE